MVVAIVLLFMTALMFLVLSYLGLVRDVRKSNVPGPHPLPIFGNGLLFLGDSSKFMETMTNLFEKYGSVVRVHILTQRIIILNKPKHIEAIISNTEHITKGHFYKFLEPWLGQGLLTASGHRWFTHRKFLTSAFHFNILKTFLPIFLKNDDIMIEKLKHLANGAPVDIFPIMALLALDNVSEAAMGVSINAQRDSKSEYVSAVNEISGIIFDRMRNPLLLYETLFALSGIKSKQTKALSILHGFTSKVIENRRYHLETSNTSVINDDTDIGIKKKSAFLDLLLLSEVDGKKLDNNTVREEVDTFMFEGHDTTTSGLSFSLYCISQHRDVQDKLFKEQQDIFGDDMNRHPTYTDLMNMKYLELSIKESLRIYPTVPLIARSIKQDTNIAGYKIPKDTTVSICIFQLQRSPDIFEDPLVFRPERFESLGSDETSVYNWISFSAGPRNCIGQKFAMMEMKVVLSSIIRKFHLLPAGIEPALCFDLILRSTNGVHVKMLPRT